MRTFFYLVPIAPGDLPYRGHCPLPLSMLSLFCQQSDAIDAATAPLPVVQNDIAAHVSALSMPDLTSSIPYSTRLPVAAAFAASPGPALPTSLYLPRRSAAMSVLS